MPRHSRVSLRFIAVLFWLASSLLAPGLAAAAPPDRAAWAWRGEDPATLIEFAQAQRVAWLYVFVSPDVATSGELPRLQQIKALADRAGIHLYALNGDRSWATDHDYALRWQRAALATGLFEGAHVDVEPHTSVVAWQALRPQTIAGYLSLLEKLQADSPLPLEADVAFWYGNTPADGHESLADAILAIVDGVAVMSYRDSGTGPDSMLSTGTDWLERGARLQKPVRLAAETNEYAPCPNCTFYEEGAFALDAALAELDAAATAYPAYQGVAIHDYTGWKALVDAQAASAPESRSVRFGGALNLWVLMVLLSAAVFFRGGGLQRGWGP